MSKIDKDIAELYARISSDIEPHHFSVAVMAIVDRAVLRGKIEVLKAITEGTKVYTATNIISHEAISEGIVSHVYSLSSAMSANLEAELKKLEEK